MVQLLGCRAERSPLHTPRSQPGLQRGGELGVFGHVDEVRDLADHGEGPARHVVVEVPPGNHLACIYGFASRDALEMHYSFLTMYGDDSPPAAGIPFVTNGRQQQSKEAAMVRSIALGFLLVGACATENQFHERLDPLPNDADPSLEAPTTTTDRHLQSAAPQVDIVWVVDNTDSAAEVRSDMAAQAGEFIAELQASGTDFHVGMIASDMGSPMHRGKLQGANGFHWIDRDTTDAGGVLTAMFNVAPPTGNNDEVGMEAIVASIDVHANAANAGFFRDGAQLHVIAVSDEDDNSMSITEQGFTEWFVALRGAQQVSFSSVVGRDYNECDRVKKPGDRYRRLSAQIGGTDWSICDGNFDQAMQRLAGHVPTIDTIYPLSELPVESSIGVSIGSDTLEPGEWSYLPEQNSVELGFVPDEGAEIVIQYENR